MPRVLNSIVDRIETFRTAWFKLAPEATFAGMTYVEFEAESAPPLTLRDEIAALETQLESKKAEQSIADLAANDVLDLVVNSLRGTRGYGRDSALYRAFGYVRKSDRKSGLTRKAVKPAVDANVA